MNLKNSWVSVLGDMDLDNDTIIFRGGQSEFSVDGSSGGPKVGNFISNRNFGGGSLSATIEFKGEEEYTSAGLILYWEPRSKGFIVAQLGNVALCSINIFPGEVGPQKYGRWERHNATGPPNQLKKNTPYEIEVQAIGSEVRIILNGINILETTLPIPLPYGQAGIWAMGQSDIMFSNFTVKPKKPKLFAIMEFADQFNRLYEDVIHPVGNQSNYEVIRADEIQGPGLIISDIKQQIDEAKAIVADITSLNANVFWEIGYAHALQKPTVLIAEAGTKLPFDVSPFRTFFYENTIGGKSELEIGLKKHLQAIQAMWGEI